MLKRKLLSTVMIVLIMLFVGCNNNINDSSEDLSTISETSENFSVSEEESRISIISEIQSDKGESSMSISSSPTPTSKPSSLSLNSSMSSSISESFPTTTLEVGDPKFKPGSLYKGPLIKFRSPGEQVTLGIWWWNLSGIVNPINGMSVDMILDMLIANNFTEIYLDVSKMVPIEEEIAQNGLTEDDIAAGLVSERHVRGFIKKCNKYDIRVAALTGAAGEGVLRWIDPSKSYYYIKSFVEKIAEYNFSAKKDEKFYSVHLDVEPHTLDKWHANRARYTQWMADFTVEARKQCDKYNLELEYDVFAWFTEEDMVIQPGGQSVNIIDLMTKQCHALGIMSYYNSGLGQFDRATNTELAYAKKNNCRLIAGTETIKITPMNITYYYQGKDKLIKEQAILRSAFDDCGYEKFGGAIHHAYSLYELMTKK